jgi:hypothetical protein
VVVVCEIVCEVDTEDITEGDAAKDPLNELEVEEKYVLVRTTEGESWRLREDVFVNCTEGLIRPETDSSEDGDAGVESV